MEESAATGVQRAKRRDSCTEDRCRPAFTSPRGLSAHPPGRAGLGAEARASVGSQGEDWGSLREHSLKGASAPQLAGRECRRKSGAAEEARDFFLPLCFLVQEKRGLRAPLKGAPEMGVSRSYQHGPQRRAGDTKAAAAATKKPVCKHRSLSTPPLPGACAARHCQGPVIQGQLPRENTWSASHWCNISNKQPTLTCKAIRERRTKNPKVSRRKEIIKIRSEINEKEMKKMIAKINKLKAGSLRR